MAMTKDDLFQDLRKWGTPERKLEFLDNALKKELPIDAKIAALVARAELYIGKRWPNLAARDYCYAGSLAFTFKEQSDLHFKGAISYLLADEYLNADDAFKKVLVLAVEKERPALKEKILNLYFERAESHEKERREVRAITTYEKLLTFNIEMKKRMGIYDKLIKLYETIGKPREANRYKEQKAKAHEIQQPVKKEEKPPMAEDFL